MVHPHLSAPRKKGKYSYSVLYNDDDHDSKATMIIMMTKLTTTMMMKMMMMLMIRMIVHVYIILMIMICAYTYGIHPISQVVHLNRFKETRWEVALRVLEAMRRLPREPNSNHKTRKIKNNY